MYHIVAMSAVSSTSIARWARWGWWTASCTPTPASQPPPCPCHGGVSIVYYLHNIFNIYPHLEMTMLTSRITKLSRNHRMQNIYTAR